MGILLRRQKLHLLLTPVIFAYPSTHSTFFLRLYEDCRYAGVGGQASVAIHRSHSTQASHRPPPAPSIAPALHSCCCCGKTVQLAVPSSTHRPPRHSAPPDTRPYIRTPVTKQSAHSAPGTSRPQYCCRERGIHSCPKPTSSWGPNPTETSHRERAHSQCRWNAAIGVGGVRVGVGCHHPPHLQHPTRSSGRLDVSAPGWVLMG